MECGCHADDHEDEGFGPDDDRHDLKEQEHRGRGRDQQAHEPFLLGQAPPRERHHVKLDCSASPSVG